MMLIIALYSPMQSLSLYFHWPFCASKCPYCDFNVHVVETLDHARWRAAYVRAIAHYAALYPDRQVKSVYFGGGTPSLMAPSTVEAIVRAVHEGWDVDPQAEITLEANPTSVEVARLQDFRSAGVNRLSLGVQALQDDSLRFLGRAHDKAQALEAIDTAQRVFDRMSFDLIYARPLQTLEDWRAELTEAATLAAGHLSLYQLTIERNTPFYLRHARGEFFLPEEGLAADFYDLTQEILSGAGLPAYEVSNHAAPGQESAHNMVYWHYGDYLGIGPGAHGRMTGGNGQKMAVRDHYAPEAWLNWIEERGCGAHEAEVLSDRDIALERLMMGLRLREGIDVSGCADVLDTSRVQVAVEQGWAVYSGSHLMLTQEGLLRLNRVLDYITSPPD